MPHKDAVRSVVQVAKGGRGFVVEGAPSKHERSRYVLTAFHCLPKRLPPDRVCQALLGPLGPQAPTVWAECLFAEEVADIAVLGAPDDQDLFKQSQAYQQLVGQAVPLAIRAVEDKQRQGWLLTLDAQDWFRCRVRGKRVLWIEDAGRPIRGGMSGSPILDTDGHAIGVCCVSGGGVDLDDHREGGPNPGLAATLPGWLLDELRSAKQLSSAARR
jgi:hypothetical protein